MTTWLAYITTGRELEVGEALAARGIPCWIARKVTLKRQGKRRRPDVIVDPYLPNYAFLELTDAQFHDLHHGQPVKHLARTMHPLRRDDEEALAAFRTDIDRSYRAAMLAVENSTRAELAEYRRGQIIRPISGPFADTLLRFRRIVESAADLHPMIEAETELFGQVVRVKVDPLDVKAAE
jgi:transcriptional antiterminator NusG